jgi:hypothetical protein
MPSRADRLALDISEQAWQWVDWVYWAQQLLVERIETRAFCPLERQQCAWR